MNQGRFGRKLIICATRRGDMDTVKGTFQSMSETVQNDPMTRFLMFKASLESWDHELGRESINYLAKGSVDGRSQDMLYACMREAQNVGDRICTLVALKAVVDTFEFSPSTAAGFLSLLRCIVRLVHMIEGQEGRAPVEESSFEEDVCYIFERGWLAFPNFQRRSD